MRDRGFLLRANAVNRPASEGKKALDFCVVEIGVKNNEGVFDTTSFFYGAASQAKAINQMVASNGSPVLCDLDFSTRKNFQTKNLELVLDNLVPVKQ